MNDKRYFVFLYLEDIDLQELLDLAIFILNPLEKWPAHVTLAGPYPSERQASTDLEFGKKVTAYQVGQFSSATQNTVYLHVQAEDLQRHWHKPDYDFTPHLTIYDGDDAVLAHRLYEQLFEARIYVSFHVSRLFVVPAIKGQISMALFSNLNTKWMPDLKGKDLPFYKNMPIEERLERAMFLLKKTKASSLHRPNLIG